MNNFARCCHKLKHSLHNILGYVYDVVCFFYSRRVICVFQFNYIVAYNND